MTVQRLTLLAILVGIFCNCASAQSIPTLKTTSPIYIRKGESRVVELMGDNLASTRSMAISEAKGLTAVPTLPAQSTAPLKVTIAAAADEPLGDRELRIVTLTGVTGPLVVTVGQYPLIIEKEPNNSPDATQPVPLPACLAGKIDAPGDVDFFRFEARKGQHLIFDVHAVRLGSPLEPVITIYDAAGRELRHEMENHGGDPMLVFDTPADGAYLLQMRDLQYRGGGDFIYRIEAGAIPYIESLVPMSGRPGSKIEVTAIGHNLQNAGKITLDLTGATEGPRPIRAVTPAGVSNESIFLVSNSPRVDPKAAGDAAMVPMPSEITGVLEHPNDEPSYLFHVAAKQQVTLAVTARRINSPLDALLTLKSAAGDVIEQSNGAGDAEARISRPLEPGDYRVSLRDLTFAGGPSYAYRLSIGAPSPAADFSLRFSPDTARIPRGGRAGLWCEVTRTNGFKGPVKLRVEGLPAGVAADEVTIDENTSGFFSLAATADAPLGTYPLRLFAFKEKLTRAGEPELNARVVRQAYLTVTEAAPFTVEGQGILKREQLTDYPQQVAELNKRLRSPTPQLAAGQAAWEKQFDQHEKGWRVLDLDKLASAGVTTLATQPDGSVQAGGPVVDLDTYTLTATTDAKAIVSFRLEALASPTLPAGGPGRAPNGNFVVTHFAVTAAPKSDLSKARPVAFKAATATFEQAGYPVASTVLAGVPGGGWAIAPELGKSQAAVFQTASPVGFDGGTVLTFTLDQRFASQHLLGRFRLSVSSDPKAAVELQPPSPPDPIVAILKTPADKRTVAQLEKLGEHYRSIAPELAADRAELDHLRKTIGPYVEMAGFAARIKAAVPGLEPALRKLLSNQTPDLPLFFTSGRNRTLSIPVPIHRAAGFAGEVQVTLEGFSAGRDPATRLPAAIAKNFAIKPLTLKGSESFGKLTLQINPTSEVGTRMVVLRAEAKVGNDIWVQYSPAFPLMVTEK